MTRKTASFNMEETLLDLIKSRAEETGESVSEIMNQAATTYLRAFQYEKEYARRRETGADVRARHALGAMAAYSASLGEPE